MPKKYLVIKLLFFLAIPFTLIILFSSQIKSSAATIQHTNVNATVPGDLDNDGMPSWWETKYGLDPTDPSDAPLDNDGDGLTNLEEYIYNTDPNNRDTDGGGMPDGKEIYHHRNPSYPGDDMLPIEVQEPNSMPPDDRGDSDGDGLTNIEEKKYGTDQKNIDTDGDGLNDFEEVFVTHTNPLAKDTDGDGIEDFPEVRTYKTDPTKRDSDFDGLTDPEELFTYKTDPNNWDTDGGQMSDGDEIVNKSDPLNKDDDFQFVWNVYYGEVPNNLFDTLKNNKIDIYEGMNLTVEAVTPSDANNITISYNDKSLKTEKPYVNLKLLSPKKAGLYPIQIDIELKSGNIIVLRKYVEVKQRGQIISIAEGNFKNLYNKFSYFKTKPAPDTQIDVFTYDEITNKMVPFVSNIFPRDNPTYTDTDGRYFIALHPGNYLIKVTKPEYGSKEILFNSDKYAVFSDDIYLSYNYDGIVWGGLFILIFILVWQCISLVTHFRYWINRIVRAKAHEVY